MRRTTRCRMSMETHDGFLVGLDTGAWRIVERENNVVTAYNKLNKMYNTILMVSVKFINYIYVNII